MSDVTVIERPTAFNTFRLDSQISPGVSILNGKAQEEIQDQRQLLTTGANTVVQYSKNAVLQYELTLWQIGNLQLWNIWEAMFLDGRKRRPPRIYTIVDLRMKWVKRVIFESMSSQGVDKPGGPWKRTLELHEYNKIAPYGGPIKPGYLDTEIKAAEAAVVAKTATLNGLDKARKSIPPGTK